MLGNDVLEVIVEFTMRNLVEAQPQDVMEDYSIRQACWLFRVIYQKIKYEDRFLS